MPARATLRESGTPFLARSRGGNTKTPTPEPLSPSGHDPAEREVCIANISPRERLRRLIGGVIPFVLALAILTWQISAGLDRLWRLPLFLLFAAGTAGFFQWRDKTWVRLAARGSRQLTDEIEKIEDEAQLAQVRKQARGVTTKAVLVGILLTLIALALPVL